MFLKKEIKISIFIVVAASLFLSFFVIWSVNSFKPKEYIYLSDVALRFHEQKQKIKLLAVGDIMLGRSVGDLIKKYPQSPIYPFAEISSFFQYNDIVLANLEGPITDNGYEVNTDSCILFKFATSTAEDLAEAGINIVSLANNHTYNQGEIGFEDTQKFLEEANVASFGSQVEENDKSLVIKEIKNKKIAFIGLNNVGRYIDKEKTASLIAKAQEESDFTAVYIHWGTEYAEKENQAQKDLAYWLIDEGVDVVIGSHPHVTQPMEVYKNKMIFYSLGNFIFDQYFSQETQEGLMVQMVFDKGNKIAYNLLLVKENLSQPQLMEGQEKKVFLEKLADLSDVDDSFSKQIKSGKIILDN